MPNDTHITVALLLGSAIQCQLKREDLHSVDWKMVLSIARAQRALRLRQLGLTLACMVMQTLERSYLLRINGAVVERPQHMLMRVAVDRCSAICNAETVAVY